MPISKEILDEVGLSEEEYEIIVRRLGREPNPVEMGMFGSLWSEHCGYKHSKLLLKRFPTTGRRVLVKVGEENAGVVDIGDGLAVVMKIESHNHPSAIDPFNAAATGVGGVVRDILTMGARPIAVLDSLRFGPLSESRSRELLSGVVSGIAYYAGHIEVPGVGGEVFFAPAHSSNPLVNAMCVGLLKASRLVKARASGVGNPLMLVGGDTGRDGLHGATFASLALAEGEKPSPVAIGNPKLERQLIAACLELFETDYLVGMQDLGAAGLTCSTVECAARAGTGVAFDVLKVPRREAGMTPEEVLLSESQERMLLIVKRGCEDRVKALFDKWDLRCDIIGQVTADGVARVREGDSVVAEVLVALLTDPPLYHYPVRKPAWLTRLQNLDLAAVPDVAMGQAGAVLLRLLSCANIASREWVYRQYDHQVQTNTVMPPGGDAAVLRIKGTGKGIALASDGNGRLCYLDPYVGGAMTVAEAARNVVCVGAEPIALTDCLNFGNPQRSDIYYQLKECIRGMARACRFLGIPVVSGNVSLYNETGGEAVYPTPVVGMLGLMNDIEKRCTLEFKAEGDLVFLLGPFPADVSALSGSEYLEQIHGTVAGRPRIHLELERRVQRCCLAGIRQGIIRSAHDCSEGGLAVAVAECSIKGGFGFRGRLSPGKGRVDAALFGEAASRIVVSVAPGHVPQVEELCRRYEVPLEFLGEVGGKRFVSEGHIDLPLERMEKAWRGGLEAAFG